MAFRWRPAFTRAVAGGAWGRPMPQPAAPQPRRGPGPPARQPSLGSSLPVPAAAPHLQALQRISEMMPMSGGSLASSWKARQALPKTPFAMILRHD